MSAAGQMVAASCPLWLGMEWNGIQFIFSSPQFHFSRAVTPNRQNHDVDKIQLSSSLVETHRNAALDLRHTML
jgi:hypothetical protein